MTQEEQVVAIVVAIIAVVVLIKLWKVVVFFGLAFAALLVFVCAQDESACPLGGNFAKTTYDPPGTGLSTGNGSGYGGNARHDASKSYPSPAPNRPEAPQVVHSKSWVAIENCKTRCRSDYDMRTEASERARCTRRCEQR